MIISAKFQFCYTKFKIINYICNANGHHPDISKILKILNWLKCTNVTFIYVFIGVYIYYQIQIKDFAQITFFIYYLFKKNILFI